MVCCRKNKDLNDSFSSILDDPFYDDDRRPKWKRRTIKALKITSITLLVIAVLLFIIIFVALPLVVTFSLPVQTFLMFPNILQPKDPQYENFALYGASATRNFYVSVNDSLDSGNIVSLGMWHLVPTSLIEDAENNENFDYDYELKNSGHPVLIYFHGNSGTRIAPLKTYLVLRKFFHVLAFDYRSYADSTQATLTETAVVDDGVQLYKWVMQKTKSDIYVWGHSLGTALSTHTLKKLKEDENIVPKGLFLEAAFTAMKEEIPVHPFGKIFAWLPWFDLTIVQPLQNNEFFFDTIHNILSVDCPIMQMHAEDDNVIPYTLGVKLSEVAAHGRNTETQGPAIYYQFAAKLKYSHLQITNDPNIPDYVESFIKLCNEFGDLIRSKALKWD